MIYHIYRAVEDGDPVCDIIEAGDPIEAVYIGMDELRKTFYQGWDDANPLSREEYLKRVDFLMPSLYRVIDIKDETGRSAWNHSDTIQEFEE